MAPHRNTWYIEHGKNLHDNTTACLRFCAKYHGYIYTGHCDGYRSQRWTFSQPKIGEETNPHTKLVEK